MKVKKALRIAEQHWGDMKSSVGVPYMRHVQQGVRILDYIYSDNPGDVDLKDAKVAFILHGMFQDDNMLMTVGQYMLDRVSTRELLLIMEYRNLANSYLREHVKLDNRQPPKFYPIPVVQDMLVADKIQNYDNFVKHYLGRHIHSDELEQYFNEWFDSFDMDIIQVDSIRNLCCHDT